jgi:putative transposase
MDLFSRRMLGYAMSAHHDTTLTTASMKMAAATRGGDVAGVIFHSDRGGEYTGKNFNNLCDFLKVNQSMGRVASALDNVPRRLSWVVPPAAESVNSTLKTEFTHRRVFTTRADARQQIGGWISNFYNARRRHSWCGGISPIAMETAYRKDQQQPTRKEQATEIRSAA